MAKTTPTPAKGKAKRPPHPIVPLSKMGGALPWLAAGLTLVVFLRAVDLQLIHFGDDYCVADKPLANGLTLANIRRAWTSLDGGLYMPLTWLSFQVDFSLHGPVPQYYHTTNVILHAANAALLLLLLRRCTGSNWRSALATALFALHPMRVESVAWIVERKDLLATFMALLSMWAYSGYVRQRSHWRYGLFLCLFGLCLLAKPTFAPLAGLLVLADYWPVRRWANPVPGAWQGILPQVEKIPPLLLSAGTCLLTLCALPRDDAAWNLEPHKLWIRLADAAIDCAICLRDTFWFGKLGLYHPLPRYRPPMALWGSIVLLAVITIVAVRHLRSRPWLAVGWFWFVGMLLPNVGLVRALDVSHADRFTYFPSIGLAIAIAWSIPDAWVATRTYAMRLAFASAVVLIALSTGTFIQFDYWENDVAAFGRSVALSDAAGVENWFGQRALARALLRSGRADDALPHFKEASGLNPQLGSLHDELARVMWRRAGTLQAQLAACEQFRLATECDPKSTQAHSVLARHWAMARAYTAAEGEYRIVLRLHPGDIDAQVGVGYMLALRGEIAAAQREWDRAIDDHPGNADICFQIAQRLELLLPPRLDLAAAYYRQALAIDPAFAPARARLNRIKP